MSATDSLAQLEAEQHAADIAVVQGAWETYRDILIRLATDAEQAGDADSLIECSRILGLCHAVVTEDVGAVKEYLHLKQQAEQFNELRQRHETAHQEWLDCCANQKKLVADALRQRQETYGALMQADHCRLGMIQLQRSKPELFQDWPSSAPAEAPTRKRRSR